MMFAGNVEITQMKLIYFPLCTEQDLSLIHIWEEERQIEHGFREAHRTVRTTI